jgi:hypothetical protein
MQFGTKLGIQRPTNPKSYTCAITKIPECGSRTKKDGEVGSSGSEAHCDENLIEENYGVTTTDCAKD